MRTTPPGAISVNHTHFMEADPRDPARLSRWSKPPYRIPNGGRATRGRNYDTSDGGGTRVPDRNRSRWPPGSCTTMPPCSQVRPFLGPPYLNGA